jgi:cell division protein FtsI/penicillin-binding protein 2
VLTKQAQRANRIKVSSIPPTRGIIYDKHGRILAENLASYSLELIPDQVTDMEETLQRLQLALSIPPEKIAAFKLSITSMPAQNIFISALYTCFANGMHSTIFCLR